MDSANVLDISTCGICLEAFDESSKCPRMLSCGHSYCHSCLWKLLAQSPCCPTCKAEILFQTTEAIPINFSLKSLIITRSQILARNTSTNLEEEISDSHTGNAAKRQRKTGSRKNLSEGYCNEHEHFKELRCMDCKVWICGLCSTLKHKHCRNLVVEEAYKELKKQVSQRVEEELCQRKTRTEGLTESLRVMEEERKSLIDEIKRKELELKDREKRIQELESLKLEENKFCDKLKKLQTMVENSANDAFSKNLIELEKLLEEGKKQIPVALHPRHLPQTRGALGMFCQSRSVYALEDRYDGTRYGKVALKDGRILVASFQQEKPEDASLFALPKLLSRFNNGSSELPKTVFFRLPELSRFNNGSSELPKTVFLRVTPDGGRDDSFEVIIKTDGLTPRAKNFILLCSALKGPSYKGMAMTGDSSSYDFYSAPSPVVEGVRDDEPETPLKEGGVYGMRERCSWFQIQLKDLPFGVRPKFGVVVAGLQQLKDLGRRNCIIEECGLVI